MTRFSVMQILIGASITALGAAFCPSIVQSRQIMFQDGATSGTVKDQLEQLRDFLNHRMLVRIDELNRVCDLSENQLTEFNVVAKGAVEYEMRATKSQVLNWFNGRKPTAVTENHDGANESDTDPDQAAFERFVVFAIGNDAVRPEQQPIWLNGLERILTEAQRKKYDADLAERMKRLRQIAVATFVAKVDSELVLQNDQREKLTLYIDDHYGELWLKNFGKQSNDKFFVGGMIGRAAKPAEEIKAIFNESQLHIWETKFAIQLEWLK